MTETDLLFRLGVALAIGLLVGMERGWQTREAEDHSRTAGFRTFALTGLLGGVVGAVALRLDAPAIIGPVFLAFAAIVGGFEWLAAQARKAFSVTSVVAGMVTFLLGTLAVVGDLRAAIAAAVATTVLLALRDPLHRWVASLSWAEIRAVLILLVMTFLMLPLLPDRTVDPFGVINPSQIWILAITVAGISFLGYVATRLFGDRLGLFVMAAAGGLASSTATTLTLARLAREEPGTTRLISAGISISALVMLLRVAVIAGALNPALIGPLWLPLASAAVVFALAAALQSGAGARPGQTLIVSNPLVISTALKLALLIAVVLLLAEAARRVWGTNGVFAVAALSGLGDVDAATVSMARIDSASLPLAGAAKAIVLAVAVNTLSKAAMAAWIGGRALGLRTALASITAVLAMAFALYWTGVA